MSTPGAGKSSRPQYRLIEDEPGLLAAVAQLEAELSTDGQDDAPVFLDTEFESNRQGVRLCLLQVSVGHSIYLLDALRLPSLAPLGSLLTKQSLIWVLHAGLQDLRLIEQAVPGAVPRRLLDTQIGWALLGPEYSVSLAYLEYKVIGVRADKGHQADDWVRRPIPTSQLDYAARDVAFLPAIFEHVRARLVELQRFDVAVAASLGTLMPEPDVPQHLRVESFRNAWQLSPQGLAALALLIDFYNGLSQAEQSLLGEAKLLMSLAARLPRTRDDLGRIKGVGRGLLERQGERILSLLRTATEQPAPSTPALEPAAYGSFAEHRMDAWMTTLRAEVCAELGVAPELALPSRWTRRLLDAYGAGGVPGLLGAMSGWRKSLLLAAVARFCEQRPPPV